MAGPRNKLFVCLGLCALLVGCGDEKIGEKALPRVFVQQAVPTEYAASVTLTGDIQARVQTDLSFRVGGKIIERKVDVGDRVSARQVLARLDPRDLQTNADSAEAQVAAEQARVKQSAAAFVRQQKLLPKGYTSQSEYDAAQAQLRSSQSALTAAQARRIAVAAQGFAEPKPRGPVTRAHLRRLISRIQVLQLDSVSVAVRAHYAPVFSRLGPYDRDVLDRAAWSHSARSPRLLVEYWAHEAALMAVDDWPQLRWRMHASMRATWRIWRPGT